MDLPAAAPSDKSASPPAARVPYAQSELYDSPDDLARWPLLAPLLKSWQTEVWDKDHTEFRGCWRYDQDALRLQQVHRVVVIFAAAAGTGAVVLAILQLGMEHQKCGPYLASLLSGILGSRMGTDAMQEWATNVLMLAEVACVVLAGTAVLLGIFSSLNHRWRELRFKAENYRMLKFRFLLNGAYWLRQTQEERGLHLFMHLVQIHDIDDKGIRDWIHWQREILPPLEAPDVEPDEPLARELADYFRARRLASQQEYFESRGHQLHRVERVVRHIGPALFMLSVVAALTHAILHLWHTWEEGEHHSQPSPLVLWAFGLALMAAIAPVVGAGVRTWRGAFEFGRNSLRFEAMAHHLQALLVELGKARSPEAILTILRRGEHAMEAEHRAWMRLMMEAEWFG